ncbi:hypothetical protein [Streptomyces sp. NPDC003635]
MGTSLTPEFWERFALLLFAATGVTFALAALFDALVLRRRSRRAHRAQATSAVAAPRPRTTSHRPSVSC